MGLSLEAQRRKKHEIEGRKLGIPGYDPDPEPAEAQSVASAVAQYLEHVETLKKLNTYRKYQAVLRRFSKHFEGRTVESIPIAALNGYIVHLKRDLSMSANTVLHNTIIIAQFFKRHRRGGITRLLDLPELGWDPAMIRFFLESGADVVTGSPFAVAFGEKIRTCLRPFVEFKKAHPQLAAELQEQADRACDIFPTRGT